MTFDPEKLRQDMMDYYGTAMMSVDPMAIMDLSQVEQAAPETLVDLARQNGLFSSEG